MSPGESLENPILNSPYDPPERHFELGPDGPTGTILAGRRPSEVGERRRPRQASIAEDRC